MSKLDFLKDPEKMEVLVKANQILNIDNLNINKIIFVYTIPKVGSTSLVTSFRIFFTKQYHIIHIHDEEMLRVLSGITGVTINEIILYNKHIGKEVYVIDVYRDPIELKMSTYFEKIGCHHFNCNDDDPKLRNLDLVTKRFNDIYPYIGNGDNFLDIYNIQYNEDMPESFDFDKKYLLIEDCDVKYIKLRLMDSEIWGDILSSIFNSEIHIIHDHESESKNIKDIYSVFKNSYKIPSNFLKDIKDSSYFDFYHSTEEKDKYLYKWLQKSTESYIPFCPMKYELYEILCKENSRINYVQSHHYIDDGCICEGCMHKRNLIICKILDNKYNGEKVHHENVRKEIIVKKMINKEVINNLQKAKKRIHDNNLSLIMSELIMNKN